MGYFGSKATSGLCQPLIAMIPPHDTYTRKYAEAYCRISSYLQSMANQGYNPLVAIQIALAGRAVDNLPE